MRLVITGGAGFIGRQLAERLAKLGELPAAAGKPARIDEIVLFDAVEGVPLASPGVPVRAVTGDVAWVSIDGDVFEFRVSHGARSRSSALASPSAARCCSAPRATAPRARRSSARCW